MAYSETAMDHCKNPRNVGEMKGADGVGEVGNPICGDMMTIYIKVEKDPISDIRFLTFGIITKETDIDRFLEVLNRVVATLRSMSPLYLKTKRATA